jgi:MFS family permease
VSGPDQRHNYIAHLIGGGFLFIGLQFGSTRLVVPWIGVHLGVAYFFVAAILPVTQFGLISGQLGSAPLLVRTRRRKKPVAAAALMLAIALAVVFLATNDTPAPQAAAVVMLVCMLVFGLCHGAFNVGYDDLVAKTIALERRARLTADRAALGGAVTLLLSLVVLRLPEVNGTNDDVLWFAVAGWLGVMLAYAALREPESKPLTEPITWKESVRGLGLIAVYPWYRRLLMANVLLLSVELAIPFYSIHAATLNDPSAQDVTVFVLASSGGVLIGGLLWARFSVRSRIVGGALLTAAAGALTFVVEALGHRPVPYFYGFLFVLLTLGEQGSIQGRMTYLVNKAPDHDRPILLATSNTSIWTVGIGMSALLATAGQLHDIRTPLVILIVVNLAAALYARLAIDSEV